MNVKQLMKKYAGQIAYYACVVLVLAAVAVAAERIRTGGEPDEALVLPAVELAEPVPEEKEPLFELPADTEVIQSYESHPEWNSVHRQWETHAAVDFVCAQDAVLSFSDGIVETIGKSGIYGGFIEIQCGEYLLRYCSIEAGDEIFPGKSIKKGDRLGVVDDSMTGENYMKPHLHMELWKDTSSFNIMEMVGEKF